jgi:uncharacterized membrane protein
MWTENWVTIQAPVKTVFALGADVERWPLMLPHYRYVRVLGGAGGRDTIPPLRTVEMSARRGVIPVRWTSTQALHPDVGRIIYRHVAGITRGMDVVWQIERDTEGTQVRIMHELAVPGGVLRLPTGTWIAAHVFISHIADLTLAGIKHLAEDQAASI